MFLVKQLAGNSTEVTLTDNAKVLFSYSTPVAALIAGELHKTEQNWSMTTSKHINKWVKDLGLDIKTAEMQPQSFFDNLLTYWTYRKIK